MSLADDASRPLPVRARLLVLLQLVFAKCASLLRGGKAGGEWPAGVRGEAPGGTGDPKLAGLKLTDQSVIAEPIVIAAPKLDDRCQRAELIRRRWTETGIKMWNSELHGRGRAALNIQGRVGLLPVRPGELQAGYDTLEFRLIDGCIRCEDVVVAPPELTAGLRQRVSLLRS